MGTATAETLTLGTAGAGGFGTVALPNGTGPGAGVAFTTFNVNAPQMTVAIAGGINGTNAGIIKTGLGTLTLSGSNTFDSGITIDSGTIIVTGSLAGE